MRTKLLPLLLLFTAPAAVNAANPTITFNGEVTNQTCTVDVNGQTNSVVMLPTVAMTDFGATLTTAQTAGQTSFTVTVSGCTAPTATAQNIRVKLLGYDVDPTTGVLGNRATGTDAAVGFGIQITGDVTGTNPILLNGPTELPSFSLGVGQSSVTHDYGARYYVLDAATASAGKITAVAEYALSYF